MKDYDELWNQYAIEFNNKLESANGGDWNKLDEVEQEIAALWKLTADMYSAGFDEFFLNWGYECYSYAMRGIILTNVKIFQFPHSTCRIIGQHALCGKENLIVSEYKRVADADSGMEETSCNEVYELFDNAYTKVFARFENDERIKAYADIIKYFTADDEEILEETFDIFDEKLGPLFCESAYKFYCEKLKKRV